MIPAARAIGYAIVLSSSTPCLAAPLSFTTDTFAEAYNKKAQALRHQSRFTKTECEAAGAIRICSYRLNEAASLSVTGPDGRKPANLLMAVYGGKGSTDANARETLVSYKIILAVIAPSADGAEINAVFDTLTEGLGSDKKAKTAELNGIKLSVSTPPNLGIWFSATTK